MRKPKEIIYLVEVVDIYFSRKQQKAFYKEEDAITYMNGIADSKEVDCRYHLWDDETDVPFFYESKKCRYLEVGGKILWLTSVIDLPLY